MIFKYIRDIKRRRQIRKHDYEVDCKILATKLHRGLEWPVFEEEVEYIRKKYKNNDVYKTVSKELNKIRNGERL